MFKISLDAFKSLTTVGWFFMQNNSMSTLLDGVFDDLSGLVSLFLQNNEIRIV
jgi:hypothetical protein